jgi:diguanylate cyclase (GGDEF)-like protein
MQILSKPVSKLPPDFLSSQVEALYSDDRSFLIGSLGVTAAMGVAAVRTSSITVTVATTCFLALTCLRYALMRHYARREKTDWAEPDFAYWERIYHVGASAHIAIISLFCLGVFCISSDPVDRMLALATVIAYMAGIPGRNFANAAGVDVQILLGGLPLVVAMAAAGFPYNLITVIVLLPYFVALRGLSARLRSIFVEATLRASDLRVLASNFDTALRNMPHGLAMFDKQGLLSICNSRLAQLLALAPSDAAPGTRSAALFKSFADARSAARVAQINTNIRDPKSSDPVELTTGEGRCLEVSCQPMPQGGSVVLVQDITDRKKAVARINQLALFDELTGLANRSHFTGRVAEILNRSHGSERYALLFIDLDQFKQVNDNLGHPAGDVLLKQVGTRLRGQVHGDLLARFGGDEFVVLRRCGEGTSDTIRFAASLIDVLSRPYRVGSHDVEIGASIGIALYPDHDTDTNELLKKADMALYSAKDEGRGVCRVFETEMDDRARARIELEADLHKALRRNEFELFYQPIFDLGTGRITVCEALIRWRHPRRGMISPAEFIPVAEEIGLIVDIGKWALETACRECSSWPASVSVSVNVSPMQFRRGDIVASVRSALMASGLPAHRLELELTESVLLQNLQFTMLTMVQLAGLRVKLALDDFGTGYSSLNYLHKLPLNKVKIDRSFLAGLGVDQKTTLVLGGLARLIRDLGLSLVVEGVETNEQLQLVTEATGLTHIQGYLFGRPSPAVDTRRFLVANEDESVTSISG